jgi:hypothetical protein
MPDIEEPAEEGPHTDEDLMHAWYELTRRGVRGAAEKDGEGGS